jgi:hypothetical protein
MIKQSDTSTDPTTLSIPTYQQHTIVEAQYGMRFPDGTIRWTLIDNGAKSTNIYFHELVDPKPNSYTPGNWEKHLIRKAEAASVDLAEYTAQHQLVKRTIVIAVTKTEEV